MRQKKINFVFLFTFLITLSFCGLTDIYAINIENGGLEEEQEDLFIQALSSLTYHVKEIKADLECFSSSGTNHCIKIESIDFSNEEIQALWDRIFHILDIRASHCFSLQKRKDCENAFERYYQGKTCLLNQETTEAKKYFEQSFHLLYSLWKQAIDKNTDDRILSFLETNPSIFRQQSPLFFENSKVISEKIKKRISPFVIPNNHPMKDTLDAIFYSSRATLNAYSLQASGFNILCARPRTFIRVASHPLLPGYLIKTNLDCDKRQKRGKPSWLWLVQRCIGAEKIRTIIRSKNIKHFTVAQKWIYPLPDEPSPPPSIEYTRHLAILLVTDMNLTSKAHNLYAWKHYITKEHLNEFYTIISRAKGSSYRPDNIWYTKTGQFAFIDTEYPKLGPDFDSIRGFLQPQMRAYWDKLVQNGGF